MEQVVRTGLSRERIAEAALALIDAEGLPALSMRKLGASLGVEAMSLYHYVANKDELLDAAVEQIYLEIDLPDFHDPREWEGVIRAGVRSFQQALARHPNALSLIASQPAISPGAFMQFRGAYDRLVDAGLEPADAHHMLGMLVAYAYGHVAFSNPTSSVNTLELIEITDDTDPDLATFVRTGRDIDTDTSFEHGLDTLLAGLRVRFDLP